MNSHSAAACTLLRGVQQQGAKSVTPALLALLATTSTRARSF
jgi:hypothetical protein